MKKSPKAKKKKVEEANNLDATPATEKRASEDVLESRIEAPPEIKAPPTGEEEIKEEAEIIEEKKETGERSKKKGYSQRVRELVKERKKAEAKAQSLEEKLAELTAPIEPQVAPQQPPTPQQDEPIVTPGEEITTTELDRRIKEREQRLLQQADASAQLRAKQSEAIIRINNEAGEALKTYPELDPKSKSFNKELSDSITEATEAHVRTNPYTASVKKFVAKLMKPYKRAVEKEVGKVTEKVAKQVSETALRPTSVKGKEKKFEDLSEKEMEKKLGIVY